MENVGRKQNLQIPSGFSLIEVMIALGILSVGLLAMATLVSSSRQSIAAGNQGTRAAYLAQNKMDALQAQRPFPPIPREGVEEVEGMERKWTIVQQDTSKPPHANLQLWLITVEVVLPNSQEKPFILKKLVFY